MHVDFEALPLEGSKLKQHESQIVCNFYINNITYISDIGYRIS